MSKNNMDYQTGSFDSNHNGNAQGKFDRAYFLIRSGIQDIKALGEIVDKVSTAGQRRRNADTENAVKISNVEIAAQKEANRHDEKLAELEHKCMELSNAAANYEANNLVIREATEIFKEQHKMYMALDTQAFLSSEVTSRLESLNAKITALTIELIKS